MTAPLDLLLGLDRLLGRTHDDVAANLLPHFSSSRRMVDRPLASARLRDLCRDLEVLADLASPADLGPMLGNAQAYAWRSLALVAEGTDRADHDLARRCVTELVDQLDAARADVFGVLTDHGFGTRRPRWSGWAGPGTTRTQVIAFSRITATCAAALLPAGSRAEYAELFLSELHDLAAARSGRWAQVRYACRVLLRAPRLRRALG
ncbi:hypothetical protein VSH64_16975 [Amycolatopsis rhabdoformis]|uniref:Uncharacterized protein n=1 Tax=Amycolatopsis rhabdoformis TaxID=1448059 RepID=A0ABZ1IH32_9PSEU|nr:hypothetical protein [Amycolatopsis rhabdoformis]WSE33780.1 hypothetical protein VSH64_16975 [Amycolatopsis rhabdoformis]